PTSPAPGGSSTSSVPGSPTCTRSARSCTAPDWPSPPCPWTVSSTWVSTPASTWSPTPTSSPPGSASPWTGYWSSPAGGGRAARDLHDRQPQRPRRLLGDDRPGRLHRRQTPVLLALRGTRVGLPLVRPQ